MSCSAQPSFSSPSFSTEQKDPKLFACTVCKQRKVKCNRNDPCSNCMKAGVVCKFVAPASSRRRKRKPTREGLHARLSRYERILQKYGAKIDASEIQDGSDDDSSDEDELGCIPEKNASDVAKSESPPRDTLKRAKLVSQRGKSRFIDNDLWSTLTEELKNPGDLFSDGSDEESANPVLGATSPANETALLLGMYNNQDLSALHPHKDVILRLCEIFQENVNPLIKVIHVPTFWETIHGFGVFPYKISKSLEALLFVIYLSAVSSIGDDECVQILGEPKPTMVSRYRIAAQQALTNAAFLKSTSIVTLQAYYIFLMSMRSHYDSNTKLCLTAVAVRIARRLGLHRDGVFLGLSPFEVEMRRRLWWQISFLDARTADLCGSRPSLDLQCDTKPPLNVNDSDLSPGMTETPKERSEITEMVFCMIKVQVGAFLQRTVPPMSIDALRRSGLTLLAKDEVINKLQDSLEQKFLRHCDPLQPLHLLCSIFCRIAICKLRLSVHNPMSYAGQDVSIPQSESDLIFENGMKVIGYGNMLHSAPMLQKFRWFIGANFMWDSFIYTLVELRRRKKGPEVDHAWSQIAQLFEHYPAAITEQGNPLYVAVGIWTLRVWEDCSAARGAAVPLTIPNFITQLRRNKTKVSSASPDFPSNVPTDPVFVGGNPHDYDQVDYYNQPSDMAFNTPYGDVNSLNAPDLLFFQPFPMDWAQLDHLMGGTN